MRTLSIIPIIHSRHDLGSIESDVEKLKLAATSAARLEASKSVIDSFWMAVRDTFVSSNVDSTRVLVYQDALPNSGHPESLIERRIVNDLAEGGSPNHRLVQWLLMEGATLVGTESTDLLMKEYDLVRKSLAAGSLDYSVEGDDIEFNSESLRVLRDQYIAKRVDETLGKDQLGVLFIGMLHRVEDFLPIDIKVSYPIGRPRSTVSILR